MMCACGHMGGKYRIIASETRNIIMRSITSYRYWRYIIKTTPSKKAERILPHADRETANSSLAESDTHLFRRLLSMFHQDQTLGKVYEITP